MNSSTMIEEDRKISRHTCGEWLYAGNACQVCIGREKAR